MGLTQVLIEKGADVNFGAQTCGSALRSSVGREKYEVAEFLIRHGARVDPDALAAASSAPMIDLLMSNAEKETISYCGAIHAACNRGTSGMEQILLLLARGFNINDLDKWGNTPLLSVCESDRPCLEIIQFLLNNGADVSAQSTKDCGRHAIEGDTPCKSLSL